ncbi:MAG: molybdate ABC transporter substrate-binding protein [bacterium]|nr:molybdate ABC transporter substrate-binding protein [bacterium]
MLLGISLTALLLLARPVHAERARIAIASNFTTAAKAIKAQFEQDSAHKAVLIFGSTGKLYAQIYHGAPYDVFLAADQLRPQKSEGEGLAVDGSRMTYAIGKLALYSSDASLADGILSALLAGRFNKLAIANPKTAPYGAAALHLINSFGVSGAIKRKIVMGENAAQTLQFVETGNAHLGFVALSSINSHDKGSRWIPPAVAFPPIKQDAVLLKHGADNKAAKAFLHYLKGEKTRAILKKYGYGIEK